MHIDVRRHAIAVRTRCWVNDVEVTSRCFAADDIEGWADCYVLSEDGRPVVVLIESDRGLLTERLTGVVRLEVGGQD